MLPHRKPGEPAVRRAAPRLLRAAALGLALLAAAAPASAAQASQPPPDPTEDPVMITAGFLSAHPDLRYRLLGLEKYRQKRYEDAFKFFRRAAFYADKPSQGMVGEMLWNGQGAPQDRALAYAWMDLAAERGYAGFLGLRERYWNALDEAERARAVAEGQAVYAEYGDAAATPRIDTILRRERRHMTGSRTGFAGNLKIYVPGPGGYQSIDGSKFYDERYWDPAQYRQWHDSIWSRPRIGRVDVGEVERVDGKPLESRVPAVAPRTDAEEPDAPEVPEGTPIGTRPPDP